MKRLLDLPGLQALITLLREQGYAVLGPTVRDGVIITAEITGLDDLPRSWSDDQKPASYRLRPREDEALFGFAAPAQSAKQTLFPPRVTLWRRTRAGDGFVVEPSDGVTTDEDGVGDRPKYALLGVRSCDLHAIGIHDRVLDGRAVVDPDYQARRRDLLTIAVTCSDPASTCFCASMDTGPRPGPGSGFDIALTEILAGGHRFLAEVGSPAGAELLDEVGATEATSADESAADAVARDATNRMGRTLETDGLREVLYAGADSPVWDEVAKRCLACMNCTAVCPTCFCTAVDDVTDVTVTTTLRDRIWDSCFSAEMSAVHGHSIRGTTGSRYRQWATHKFASWIDQFGTSGCVGCGRCITWCPAGIDITREVAAVRAEQERQPVAAVGET